uniref:VPS13 domain-containing protein n=1 Tax=Ascaris lumbricoides TaxID=6252 RepID=A0A0M3I1I1_ASCLU
LAVEVYSKHHYRVRNLQTSIAIRTILTEINCTLSDSFVDPVLFELEDGSVAAGGSSVPVDQFARVCKI